MRRVIRFVPLVSMSFAFLTAGAATLSAEQKLPTLRVVKDTASVRSRPAPLSEVRQETTRGMLLEAVDRQDDWYWVMLPADGHGTRRPGWIHARDVEIVSEGQPGTVLHHFATVIEAAKAHDHQQSAKEAAEEDARLERARLKVEQARREYEAAASQKTGGQGHPAAPPKAPKRQRP
jgi:hypothetical protein